MSQSITERIGEPVKFQPATKDIGNHRFRIERSQDSRSTIYHVSFKHGMWGKRYWVTYLGQGAYSYGQDPHDFRSDEAALRGLQWAHDYAARDIQRERDQRARNEITIIYQEP
jgi:hypothetical protein